MIVIVFSVHTVVVVMAVDHMHLCPAAVRAQHGHCHRATNGQQEGQHDNEDETNSFHGLWWTGAECIGLHQPPLYLAASNRA